MFDFYRFVHDSRYIGGSTEYSGLDEASPYWFQGSVAEGHKTLSILLLTVCSLVPLAFGLGDQRIQQQVSYYLDYILDHQQADGWLGWETTRATRGLWARTLLLNGLIVSTLFLMHLRSYHLNHVKHLGLHQLSSHLLPSVA